MGKPEVEQERTARSGTYLTGEPSCVWVRMLLDVASTASNLTPSPNARSVKAARFADPKTLGTADPAGQSPGVRFSP